MPAALKVNRKNLKHACWRAGLSVTQLCKELGYARNTAYEAMSRPEAYPHAHKRIIERLNLSHDTK